MFDQATRDDVAAEVMKAPKRRIDNVITRLTDSVHLLQVHTTVSWMSEEWRYSTVPHYIVRCWMFLCLMLSVKGRRSMLAIMN